MYNDKDVKVLVLKEAFKIKQLKPFFKDCSIDEIILLAVNTFRLDLQKEKFHTLPWRDWKGDEIE